MHEEQRRRQRKIKNFVALRACSIFLRVKNRGAWYKAWPYGMTKDAELDGKRNQL